MNEVKTIIEKFMERYVNMNEIFIKIKSVEKEKIKY